MASSLARSSVLCFAAFLLLAGCRHGASAPDLDNPRALDRPGLHLDYPGNWKLEEDEVPGEVVMRTFTLESPDDASVQVQVFEPAVTDFELGTFAEDVVDAMAGSMPPGAKFTRGPKQALRRAVAGESKAGVQHRYTITLLGVAVPFTAEAYALQTPARTVVLFLQAPDEDLAKERAGFDLVLSSLRVK